MAIRACRRPLRIATQGAPAADRLRLELGWRGWLWDRRRGFGFWRGYLLIGLIWGARHAPLIGLTLLVDGVQFPWLGALGIGGLAASLAGRGLLSCSCPPARVKSKGNLRSFP